MDGSLQQGIAAYKAGDKAGAFQHLTRATQDGGTAEQAWLWLSAVVESDSERLFCIDNLLRINPKHEAGLRASAALRGKGVFPAVPLPPGSGPSTSPGASPESTAPEREPLQAAPRQPGDVLPHLPGPAGPSDSAPPGPYASDGLYEFVARELARKVQPKAILKNLVDQGLPPETAAQVVRQTQKAFQKAKAEKYRKQMISGLLWTAAGVVVTVLSFVFADQLGGNAFLCYGAVIFGIIDLLVGVVGWLANR